MIPDLRSILFSLFICLAALTAFSQEQAAPADTPPAPEAAAAVDVPPAPAPSGVSEMTLADLIRAGGWILYVIIALSGLTVVLAIYLFMTVTPRREVSEQFIRRAHAQIKTGDLRGAYQMCEDRDELFANVLRAGLKMHGHDRFVIQDAMESEGERGAAALWQRISYLNSIGTIAPLLGLLGTVWGMMGAFWTIASDNAQSRSMAMAYSVAQAMVTTAGGLMLAIPALVVYYYLRGRVVKIVAQCEAEASEIIELLSKEQSK